MHVRHGDRKANWSALSRVSARLPQVASEAVRRPRWLLFFLFGRLLPVRRLVARLASRAALAQRHSPSSLATTTVLARCPAPVDAVGALRQDGLCQGLQLAPAHAAAIFAYARQGRCFGGRGWGVAFRHDNHTEAELKAGERILSANLAFADRECPEVLLLTRDPWLHAVATGYLGAGAHVIDVRLLWSYPARAATRDELARVAQDTFHFDMGDWGQVKFFFYITDVDADRGAHVFVRGSHARRPLSHQFTLFSAKSHAAIVAAYGHQSIEVIEGPSGTGFVEDPFGFHTGSALKHGHRLMLEIAFGITAPLRHG